MIMNSTSLYVTITQIILKSNPDDGNSWKDLYLLIPYLRNSICCVVCENLLVHPLTPKRGRCQHHLCQKCMHGRKKIKPACVWCKDCTEYNVNTNLHILLQCYKKMCVALVRSRIFKHLVEQATYNEIRGVDRGSENLILLIKEGAAFQDTYESKGGLPKSAYSILPCVYTNLNKQMSTTSGEVKTINGNAAQNEIKPPSYSVMFAETGNKITIKKKTDTVSTAKPQPSLSKTKAGNKRTTQPQNVRQGCRCGNATLAPGKLTCCGQRCPCYVNSKSCQQCKCRGCRNPHESNGNKVIPVLSQLRSVQNHIENAPPETQMISNMNFINMHNNPDYTCQRYDQSAFPDVTNHFGTMFTSRPQIQDNAQDQSNLIFVDM